MIAIDTNIWIYSHDKRDLNKQRRSQEIIQSATPLALLWQVGCEFIAASRKLEPLGFSQEDAWAALEDMCGMSDAVFMPEPDLWPESRSLQQQHGLSLWMPSLWRRATGRECRHSILKISAAPERSTG